MVLEGVLSNNNMEIIVVGNHETKIWGVFKNKFKENLNIRF
jgi:hypothetical protein